MDPDKHLLCRSTLSFTCGWLILPDGLNDRFCNDKFNYTYRCIPLSLITLLIFLCVSIFPCQLFRLEVVRPFSSLDIGVCYVGLSFFALCDSVFLTCLRRRCHGEGESEFLGDKSVYFIGEDESVSHISWGRRLSCICASVIKIYQTYLLSKACVPLMRTFSASLSVA